MSPNYVNVSLTSDLYKIKHISGHKIFIAKPF